MENYFPFEIKYTISIPSEMRYVELLVKNMIKEINDVWVVGNKVSQSLKNYRVGLMDFRKVALSLDEAVQNAIEHGNKFDSEKTVRITYSINNSGVEIFVEDDGPGFDPGDVPDPTALENLLNPRGRGILFMNGMMDDVYYTDKASGVRLKKSWSYAEE